VAESTQDRARAEFLAHLNATLPTKRVIAQGVIRDGAGSVLLCELTYKLEWDLPGGVVDPSESPAQTVVREVREELGVGLVPRALLAVNWLPRYRQWDDALLLVFDLGTVPDLVERAVLERREIRAVHWCVPQDLDDHAAPYVARHLRAVLAADPSAGPIYLEDGSRPGEAGRR
jgi:8-oxo-dGTP pyrophosphatase MutT (NUDIX family)